jgi:SAM-dependent methyltransferase
MSGVTDYWDRQWKEAVATSELEEYSQSIPNDFLQTITSPRKVLSVVKESKTILDYGFGTGHMCHVLSLMAWSIVDGIEISSTAVSYATEKYGDGRTRFTTNPQIMPHDLILCSNVLEHFHNPAILIDKFLDNCKYLIILVPYKGTFSKDGEDGGAGHVFSFDVGYFSNYNVEEMFTFFSRGWTEEPNPLQLCVLIKGKL